MPRRRSAGPARARARADGPGDAAGAVDDLQIALRARPRSAPAVRDRDAARRRARRRRTGSTRGPGARRARRRRGRRRRAAPGRAAHNPVPVRSRPGRAAQRQMLGYASLAGDTPAQRGALANAAIASAFMPGARAADVVAIARRALADGRLVADRLVPGPATGRRSTRCCSAATSSRRRPRTRRTCRPAPASAARWSTR